MSDENIGKKGGETIGENGGRGGGGGGGGGKRKGRGGGGGRESAALESVAGRLGQITAEQRQAIALLLAGHAVAAVARGVGVSRATVNKWLRDDRFTGAMNRWRHDMARAARSRLTAMSVAALKVINDGLARGDAQVALGVLKGLGVLRPQGMEVDEEEEHTILVRPHFFDRIGEEVGRDDEVKG